MRKIAFIALVALAAASCGKGVKVSGYFSGAPKEPVYLTIMGEPNQQVVDSTMTDAEGKFMFRVKLPDDQPTLCYISCREQAIPMLLSKGDKVKVGSIIGIAPNYTIKGSDGSEKIRELNTLLTEGMHSLDSLHNLYSHAGAEELRRELAQSYAREYYRIKRDHIRFIVENATSVVAIYALYQRLPNDESLFDRENDVIYYQMVADSVGKYHPESKYLAALQSEISKSTSTTRLSDMIEKSLQEQLNYPEIELPDMYGNKQKLSDNDGKVVLLLFWTSAVQDSPIMNAELKELYAEYAKEGFEIYAVSLDTQKAAWVNAIQKQKLPWINVSDLRGENTTAVSIYNVTTVPANYIIDKEGNIAGKNLFGDQLARKVDELVKK